MNNLEHYMRIFENFHEAIYIVDRKRKILYFNKMASKISGYTSGETVGFFCYDNILNHVDEKGTHLCYNGCPLTEAIKHNYVTDHLVYLHHKEGHRVKVHVRAIPIEEDGIVTGAIEVFTDQTERNLLIDEIELLKKMNLIDPLTGLYQRRFFNHHTFNVLQQDATTSLGVLFMDIDNFKNFIDTYGHQTGDLVLQSVSKTILYNLKQKDYVVRYGGEEFVVLLLDVDEISLKQVADMLRILVERTELRIEHVELNVTISIGATLKLSNESIEHAMDRADKAMYLAKQSGKNKVTLV